MRLKSCFYLTLPRLPTLLVQSPEDLPFSVSGRHTATRRPFSPVTVSTSQTERRVGGRKGPGKDTGVRRPRPRRPKVDGETGPFHTFHSGVGPNVHTLSTGSPHLFTPPRVPSTVTLLGLLVIEGDGGTLSSTTTGTPGQEGVYPDKGKSGDEPGNGPVVCRVEPCLKKRGSFYTVPIFF